MTETNGSPVTRAELAAHIKGIDNHFDSVEADVAEIKWGIRGIVEELKRQRDFRESDRTGRFRAWGPPLIAALIAALISLPVYLH